MLNEGMLTNDSTVLVKSEMVRQLKRLGEATPDSWERATFEALTGGKREEVDWDVEDNQAGYFLWLKTFDQLIDELVDDGYAVVEKAEGSEEKRILPGACADEMGEYSQVVYPTESGE